MSNLWKVIVIAQMVVIGFILTTQRNILSSIDSITEKFDLQIKINDEHNKALAYHSEAIRITNQSISVLAKRR